MKRFSLALAAALTLSACATPPGTAPPTPVVQVSQFANDVQLIAAAAGPLVAQIEVMSGVTPAVRSRLAQIQAQIQAVSAQVSADAAGLAKSSEAQQIAAAVNEVVALVNANVRLSASQTLLLNACASLVPTVLAAAGMAAAPMHPQAMSPEQARTILAAHAR